MGVQDRDWYQEHWMRNVLGLRGRAAAVKSSPGARAAQPRQLPPGAEAGNFWTWAAVFVLGLIGLGAFVAWLR